MLLDCSIKIEDDKTWKNKHKKKITLADIGEPTNFEHVAGFLFQNKFGPENSRQLEQILREVNINKTGMSFYKFVLKQCVLMQFGDNFKQRFTEKYSYF